MVLNSRAESEDEPRSYPCVSVAITGFVEALFPPAFVAAFAVFGAGFAFAFFEAVFGSGFLCLIGGFFSAVFLAAAFVAGFFAAGFAPDFFEVAGFFGAAFLAAGLVLAIILPLILMYLPCVSARQCHYSTV
jgi:hypothetical protein